MSSPKQTDNSLPTSNAQEAEPLLEKTSDSPRVVRTSSSSTQLDPMASFVNGLYNGASNLANLLPTGTFLAFTAIAPVITDNGSCDEPMELYLSIATVAFFALFCFFSCFTDSFQAADGKVYYGFVTAKGLWTPQLPEVLHPGDKDQYKMTWTDVIHAVLSVAVFAACALVTPNIRACFYPNLADNIVRIVPAFVGFFVSSVFVSFPSKRHGIGFPVSPGSFSFASRELASRELAIDQKGSKGQPTTPTASIKQE